MKDGSKPISGDLGTFVGTNPTIENKRIQVTLAIGLGLSIVSLVCPGIAVISSCFKNTEKLSNGTSIAGLVSGIASVGTFAIVHMQGKTDTNYINNYRCKAITVCVLASLGLIINLPYLFYPNDDCYYLNHKG